MSNPFSNLPGSDDQDNGKFTQVAGNKQTTGQKKTTTQQPKTQNERRDNRTNINDNIIVNQRQNTKNFKSDREQKPNKDISDHRQFDRKSGAGRVSEPKKGGGGRGGIGNLKDQLNQDKILSKVNQEGQNEEQKEPEPEALTLQEYYAKQGLNINDLDKKKEVKVDPKATPKSDWVAKEKLQIIKGKQDLEGQTKKVAVLKDQTHKIEFTPQQQLLGFTKDAPKKREQRPTEEPRENKKQGGKPKGNEKGKNYQERKQAPHPKLVINQDDFPSL